MSQPKPTVVGIYGIPGSGKSTLLNQLENELGTDHFTYYEGSTVIAGLVPGGLAAFKKMSEQDKKHWRELAIGRVGEDSTRSGKVAVVTGHFMFWDEENNTNEAPVCTKKDMQTFSHILYLDFPADIVFQRREHDATRRRVAASVDHLRIWQETEIADLRDLCLKNRVLFSTISSNRVDRVPALLRDFQQHNEEYNTLYATRVLDENLLLNRPHPLETVLVLDADKTLSTGDAGYLFWRNADLNVQECPLKTLFSSPMGYSYTAFRQATLLYEDEADSEQYDALCLDIALVMRMYPEFASLLHHAAGTAHVGVVVVTCGPRRVWDLIIERKGLSHKVTIIGGGRLSDGFVVTPAVKAALVSHLQEVHGLYVWAFGDSPLDLPMLRKADQSIVVVGGVQSRSQSMDRELTSLMENDGTTSSIRMRQVLLRTTVPRMDTVTLPLVNITNQEFIDSILSRLHLVHATDRGASHLLTTPMRDARVAGPALRAAHGRIGWYLAHEFLTSAIGLEEFSIPHVQGHKVHGYRLLHESQTLIVALMRGGEPMAFGVNDVFPHAMFVHADEQNDLTSEILQDRRTVILVDSVINSGTTICQFVERIRSFQPSVHIVVVAGVVQSKAVCRRNPMSKLGHDARLTVVALRLSENQFTGKGTTDTGNRLFNTVHL